MTGILKVDQWKDSGDNTLMTSDGAGNLTVNAPFSSTGIDDNATSTAITIDSSQRVGITEQINKTVNNSQLIIAGGNDSNQGGNILLYGPSASPANTIIYRQGTSEILRMDSEGLKIGGTGGANALDDYEEGVWTPVLRGDSWVGSLNYTQQQGIYIKVGRLVFVSVFLAWNANNFSSSSGRLDLQGLPFTASNQNNYRGGVPITYTSNAWTGLTIYQQAFRVESSASKFGFNFSDATDGTINTEVSSHTHIQSSGSFMLGGTYATD